ncbi:MAG: hypothetical protein PHP52_11825 [Bacteroidales bacterium]|nr:hypothetical protein [Bacteroidales bacterium]MDD4218372.1 hypothetical protein [Bacteroidales bacterium]MDY0140631.1 hypothetical protein [Bacteroidales bacterium]
MRKLLLSFVPVLIIMFSIISCNNQKRDVNKEGVESDLIKVESPILTEYGKLMPQCKNILTVEVEGIDIADAIVYIDDDAGDAYMGTAGVGLVPYEGGKNISMIVSFDDEGGTKEFEVADKLPEPYVRFFNALNFEIQDYSFENVAPVIVEIIAEQKFAELFPEDNKYMFTSFVATQMRGEQMLKGITVEEGYESNQIDISTLQENAEVGDIILINITGIQRIDFEGNAHNVEIPEKMKEIKLTVKGE